MVNIISVASELGYLNVPGEYADRDRSVEKLSKMRRQRSSQPEARENLWRLVTYGSRYP